MQSFWFFVSIPQALPTVAKELGCGGKATTNNKFEKLTFDKLKNFQYVLLYNN